MKDNTVIVVDLGNYVKEAQEKVPFKAIVIHKYEHEIVVKSLKTDGVYEIYYNQTLEGMEDEDMEFIINLDNYGAKR